MREISHIATNVYSVVSEPGDATRYEYLVYRDGPEEYTFTARRNQFGYPRRIRKWEIEGFEDDLNSKDDVNLINIIADREGVNPHTVLECCRVIQELNEVLYE